LFDDARVNSAIPPVGTDKFVRAHRDGCTRLNPGDPVITAVGVPVSVLISVSILSPASSWDAHSPNQGHSSDGFRQAAKCVAFTNINHIYLPFALFLTARLGPNMAKNGRKDG
jgi:hypothetical protein